MNEQELDTVIKKIQKDYFLIKKSNWFSFLGGLLAFAIAAGFISYQAAIKAINQSSAMMAIDKIKEKENKANELLENIVAIRIQAEDSYKALKDRENEKLFIRNELKSLDSRLSDTEISTKTFREFHSNYKEGYLYFGKPHNKDNTNHIWGSGDATVLGGQIQLRGDTGESSLRIRYYPDEEMTRVSSPTIRVETGITGGAELVVNGNLKIENGTITVRGKEVQTE